MPREIEHKFLLKSPAWRAEATRVERMTQGYIAPIMAVFFIKRTEVIEINNRKR